MKKQYYNNWVKSNSHIAFLTKEKTHLKMFLMFDIATLLN